MLLLLSDDADDAAGDEIEGVGKGFIYLFKAFIFIVFFAFPPSADFYQ